MVGKIRDWTVETSETAEGTMAVLTKGERAPLTMLFEKGMAEDVMVEYATTRVLQAEIEDVARAVVSGSDDPKAATDRATFEDIRAALYNEPASDESARVKKFRRIIESSGSLEDLRKTHDRHVRVSRMKQVARQTQLQIDAEEGED